jgi:hypothetical protein
MKQKNDTLARMGHSPAQLAEFAKLLGAKAFLGILYHFW